MSKHVMLVDYYGVQKLIEFFNNVKNKSYGTYLKEFLQRNRHF